GTEPGCEPAADATRRSGDDRDPAVEREERRGSQTANRLGVERSRGTHAATGKGALPAAAPAEEGDEPAPLQRPLWELAPFRVAVIGEHAVAGTSVEGQERRRCLLIIQNAK